MSYAIIGKYSQEYFPTKTARKIKIFCLGRKKQYSHEKGCISFLVPLLIGNYYTSENIAY